MTLPSKPFRTRAILITAAAVLSACGGGSSSVPAPAPSGPPGPPPDVAAVFSTPSVALVASVPTPTYPVGSEELAAFNKLNEERGACGFGLLKQDIRLDAAAKGHADWKLFNGYGGHYQDATLPLFTGVGPNERVAAAAYANFGTFQVFDEIVGARGTSDKTGYGISSVRDLLNAPLHAQGMLSGAIDVGIAIRSSADVGVSPTGPRVENQYDLAYMKTTGHQDPAAQVLLTYPCEGRTGVARQLNNEDPNPVPGRDLLAQPLGTSVQLRVRDGQTLLLTTYTMTEIGTGTGTGTSVTVRPPVGAQYNNEQYAGTTAAQGTHRTWIAADAPLKALTPYRVSLAGTIDGVAFSRQFVFTTGN